MKSCTPWKTEHSPSGSSALVRRCSGHVHAEIMFWKPGDYSWIVRGPNGERARGHGKTMAAAKAAASRKLR